ncbi:alpha-tocopherol transfer protein-like isoform X2 [Varroa destructor]|uniref:CRAL-TRIO domain-containing protein n=1 Tax=Varroa destructor TaxID=109461 RepID=A0A7M7MDG8_VARDE|nr:alpha-tocopherol transfer protein-like isoform X2 [Varroa destructor]
MGGNPSGKKCQKREGLNSQIQSQVDCKAHPFDWKRRAKEELGETPEIRTKALKELSEKVRQIENFNPRVDENFLLRFLRSKKFDVEKAYKSYRKFHTIRLIDPARYLPVGVGPLRYKPAFDLATGTQLEPYNPIDGAFIVIWRVGKWSPECGFDLSDIFTPTAMGGDFRLRQDQAQALIMTIQDGYPCRFKGFHVINQSSLWDYVWAVARPFLKEKIKKRVYLHGSNMASLHKHVCPSVLPEEYGGQAGPFSWSWITRNLYERNDEFIRLSRYGYITNKEDQLDLQESNKEYWSVASCTSDENTAQHCKE